MMLKERWIEIFEVKGELAIRNVTIFITIMVGSLAVLYLAMMDKLSAEIFGCYMLAGGGVYGFGKMQDEKTIRSQIIADATPQPINTTINQPNIANVAGQT